MASYSGFKKINSEAIINSAVTGTKFAADSVTTAKVPDGSVQTADIADGAVGTNQLSGVLDLSSKSITYRPIINADISASAAIDGAKLASGAATTNLGFTPLNKAGDTATASLQTGLGSAAAPAISDSNGTTGIFFPTANEIAISTGGVSRLTIDGTKIGSNNQPAFYASSRGGWYYHNSFPSTGSPGGQWRELLDTGVTDGWQWQVTQQGGSNMSSEGRFTAPVAGYYYFYAQAYMYNDTNNSSGYSHFNIGRNRSIYTGPTGRAPHTIYGHGVPSNYVPGIMASTNFYMNAGDYASVCPYMAPVARFHGNHALFCGYLIG